MRNDQLLLLFCTVYSVSCCYDGDWTRDFDYEGLSFCPSNIGEFYIDGFERSPVQDLRNDDIKLLERTNCCPHGTFWSSSALVTYVHWATYLSQNNTWALCPKGYYLNGLYRSYGDPAWLHNIEYGRCVKPVDHPHTYGHCVDANITVCFNRQSTAFCECPSKYFVVGIYKSNCKFLHCIDKLRCCQMMSKKPDLKSVASVKTLAMEVTVTYIAIFANQSGYAYCQSCLANIAGEDFRRHRDKWYADHTGSCTGYMNSKRLNITYQNWRYVLKNITYGDHVEREQTTEIIDSGILSNNQQRKSTLSFTRSVHTIRSVDHKAYLFFTGKHLIRIPLRYVPTPVAHISHNAAYKFTSLVNANTTLDETGREQVQRWLINTSKTLNAGSSVGWDIILVKKVIRQRYEAIISPRFSIKLRGLLRRDIPDPWDNDNTNATAEPRIVTYQLGNSSTSFIDFLSEQSDTNSVPLFMNETQDSPNLGRKVMKILIQEERYDFNHVGVFDETITSRVELRWKNNATSYSSEDAINATAIAPEM